MSIEANKGLVRGWIETGLNTGDWDCLDDFFSPSYTSPWFHGTAALRQSLANIRDTFPDPRIEIQELIAENDRVVARCIYEGTHRGSFLQRPPTGRRLHWEGVTIYRIAEWAIWDQSFVPKLDGSMTT